MIFEVMKHDQWKDAPYCISIDCTPSDELVELADELLGKVLEEISRQPLGDNYEDVLAEIKEMGVLAFVESHI